MHRLSLALLLPIASSYAQESVQTLDRVVVTATRTERSQLDVPASTDVVNRDEVRDTHLRVNLSESLVRVPGLVVLNRQNYAQDLQISVRGFGARSTFGVRGIRLYADGIPATMPDGQGQVSHFALNAVDRIEVLRGPFSALYGNSSGGVIAMTTRLESGANAGPNAVEVSGAAGSYDTWRAGINIAGGSAPYAYAIDASRFLTDGYRDYSQARRDVVNLRAAALDTPLGNLRITLNSLDIPDAEDPLGLTRAQWQDNPRQASPQALQFRTRKSTDQQQLGAQLTGDFTQRWSYQVAAWGGRRAVTQFQAIPVAVQMPPNHPGGVIDFDRTYGGVDARVQLALDPVTLTLGANVERLDEDRRGYENFTLQPALTLGTLGRLRRDENNIVESRDVYAQLESRIGPGWRLHAGVRASEVEFRGEDHFLANGDDSGRARYHSINPTAGVVYRTSQSSSVYASYGRGFETPTLNELAYRPDGSAGFNTSLEPARSNNYEVGAKAVASPTLRGTIAAFYIDTKDDIVVRTNAGGRSTFANAAATRRRGLEASVGWEPLSSLSLYASAAAIRAEFAEPFLTCTAAPCTQPTVLVAAGNRLPGVPSHTAYAEAKYRLRDIDFIFEVHAQSKLRVDDRNTDAAPGYATLNAAIARTFLFGASSLRAFVRIDNLLNARTIGSVIVNEANGRYFEPAPGRSWLAGLDARF
ncbi:MAG TPA: TonB-dependent receptor [Burkholderiaceae bacterium]|nr:TonB-dependent receptor [Burkholderiaceae bacterium]